MIILCDLDHTISDAAWRDDLIGNWDEYHSRLIEDAPIKGVVTMINAMYFGGADIYGITARPEKWRALTNQWLLKHGVEFERLLMRDDDDYRPAHILKPELARLHIGEDYAKRVALVIDDRADVIEAFAAEGIVGMLVHGTQKI